MPVDSTVAEHLFDPARDTRDTPVVGEETG